MESAAREPLRRRLPVAVRMAFFYAVSFSALGVIVPFLPVWLAHRGLDPIDISLVLGAGQVVRIFGNTGFGRLADRLGERRRILMGLTVISFLSFLLLLPAQGFFALLGAYVIASLFYPAQVSLTENLGVLAAYQRGYDYGIVRLWGSVTFIAATLVVGRLTPMTGPEGVIWVAIGTLGLTAASAWLLPDVRVPLPAVRRRGAVAAFLRNPVFLLFLGANALVQGSHAAYYTFSALYWQKAGLSDFTIGLIWSEGVLAEIVLFAISARFVNRLRPTTLIVVAGFGGILRWGVIAMTTDVAALLAVNWLHAASFAFAHLGAMHFIPRAIPPDLTATAQGLYSSVGISVAVAATTMALGPLYAVAGGAIFAIMAGFCALSAILAIALDRRWDGRPITL
ncbi:MFS transporter [Oleomonas cavernae]|nr:MFS transporter [Oleomonas cavernae]